MVSSNIRPLQYSKNINNIRNDPQNDTIYALSSGSIASPTAISVIRLSGPQSHDALSILLSNTSSKESIQKNPPPKARFASHRTLYDPIPNNNNSRRPLDSSIIIKFDKNNSFTGENCVEFHTHGSHAVLKDVLNALFNLSKNPYNLNIRPADRGEFTQRAFKGGKLGVLEVEALSDLIASDTKTQRLQALHQLSGQVTKSYQSWIDDLVEGLAHVNAMIDFGEEEELCDNELFCEIQIKMMKLRKKIEWHLRNRNSGELVRKGVKIGIFGPPNVGKSTLLNLLSKNDVAIVSPIAGTTRDVVEVRLDLDGVTCILSDTAGMRNDGTENSIEIEGMKRTRRVIKDVNIVICMVDVNESVNGLKVVNELLNKCDNIESKIIIVLFNKIDLLNNERNMHLVRTEEKLKYKLDSIFEISCQNNTGMEKFMMNLTKKVHTCISPDPNNQSDILKSDDNCRIITRARHVQHVTEACKALKRFEDIYSGGYSKIDVAAEELRLAASELGRITGAVDVEEILDVIFQDFCVGK